MLARNLMNSSVVTTPPQATTGEATRLMVDHDVSCLAAVDDQDHLAGLITRPDFLKLFANC